MNAPAQAEGQAHRGAGRAEREARDRVAPRAGTIRGRILVMLVKSGDLGLTSWEAWKKYAAEFDSQIGLYSVAPRLSELAFDGYAEQSGSYRRPEPGASSREVYVATHSGRVWLAQETAAGRLS